MTYLVTGATGLVGNNVARVLLERGQRVRVLVRPGADQRPFAGLEVEQVPGDVCDATSVDRACQGVSHVIHSAAVVYFGWSRAALQHAVNVEGTRLVAEAARRAGARLVHVSSVDALGIGRPGLPADEESPREGKVPCPYVLTKRAAEDAVRDAAARGLDAVIVNPGFMLGPWDWKPSSGRMLIEVARRFMPLAPRGGLSVCDVRDVAAAIVTAAERAPPGQQYILAGENTPFLDLWRTFADVSGGGKPWCRLGPLQGLVAGWGGDLWTRVTGRELDLNSAGIRMANQCHYYSSARAHAALDYRPRPFRTSVVDAWNWFLANGYVGNGHRGNGAKH